MSGRGKDSNQYQKLTSYDVLPYTRLLNPNFLPSSANIFRVDEDKKDSKYTPTSLTGALVTTQYDPTIDVDLKKYLKEQNHTVIVSPSLAELKTIYESYATNELSEQEFIPLYWSGGLLLHPEFMVNGINYARDYLLLESKDLIWHKWMWNAADRWGDSELIKAYALPSTEPLIDVKVKNKFVQKAIDNVTEELIVQMLRIELTKIDPKDLVGAVKECMVYLGHISYGQMYCGFDTTNVTMNVFKIANICMTSFSDYNVTRIGYQQVPWMINFDGLPIFTRSGTGDVAPTKKPELCTNFNEPAIKHHGDTMLITYVTTNTEFYVFDETYVPVHIFWPVAHFASQSQFNIYEVPMKGNVPNKLTSLGNALPGHDSYIWRIVASESSYLAYMCTQSLSVYPELPGTTADSHVSKIPFQVDKPNQTNCLVTNSFYCLTTNNSSVSFVVVVGTKAEYDKIEDFVNNKLQSIEVTEANNEVKVSSFPDDVTRTDLHGDDTGTITDTLDVLKSIFMRFL